MSKDLLRSKIEIAILAFLLENKERGDEFEENHLVEEVFEYFKSFIQNPKYKIQMIGDIAFGLPENNVNSTALFRLRDEETGFVGYSTIVCEFDYYSDEDKCLTNLILDEVMTEEELKDKLSQQLNNFLNKSKEEQFMLFWTM